MTKLLLDSGDPKEYKDIQELARTHNQQLWGSTTNPSLIAKEELNENPKKKLTRHEAYMLQEKLVLEIVKIVPGAVSAEVYADHTTTAEDMASQGESIASWHPRVVVKLPTTLEGFKARTLLRKHGITINNTLVFSQQQVFAIAMHEQLMMEAYGPTKSGYPCFISPFVGRLDDKGRNGMSFVRNSLVMLNEYFPDKSLVWMLIASIRSVEHLKASLDCHSDLITVPAKIYSQWFGMQPDEQEAVDYTSSEKNLSPIAPWNPSESLLNITAPEMLLDAMSSDALAIDHELTRAGIDKFVADWKTILQ